MSIYKGVHTVGYWHDHPKNKKTIKCLLGLHKACRYIFLKDKGVDYFVCRRCGKRFKV